MRKQVTIILPCILLFLVACSSPILPELVQAEYKKLPKDLDFNQHIKPILSDKCFACHGPDKAKIKAGLQLHLQEKAYAELPESPGKYAIVPGSLKKSELVHRILSDDPGIIMPEPDSHLTLTAKEKASLLKWIKEGAVYKDHWAYIPPKNYDIPKAKNTDTTSNAIDNFILDKLYQEKLEPAPKAAKETLLRRVSFDLTGLPPTLEEINNFVTDTSVRAYEKQVDRLLASPNYGEQMALHWMDLSRFADTHGYSVDRYRDMSPWRDWVIQSFNRNMHYDDFVTWQLAGDLFENPTQEMKLATAFNRIHPQNMEGGIVNEEFLVEYAVDRASTFGQAFMGLTVACARCHDHKYDPISHKNFYELTSFFNNINESGQISWNNAMPVPTLLLTTDEEAKMIAYMDQLLLEKEETIKTLTPLVETNDFNLWVSQKKYQTILQHLPENGLEAYFPLNNQQLENAVNPNIKGVLKRESVVDKTADLVIGKYGKGVQFNGDTWLDLSKTAVFSKSDAFTISLWGKIPENLSDGNIFHKGDGAILYNWRGYHLKIAANKLELLLAHTAPGNAIIKTSLHNFPRDEWVHFSMTYDGSSTANGLKLFINGKEAQTKTKVDNLYKDILFRNGNEPGLQLGARWRGKGIKGSVVDEIRVYNRQLAALEIMQLAALEEPELLSKKSEQQLTIYDKTILKELYKQAVSKKMHQELEELSQLRKAYADSIEKIKEVMVMKETKEPVQSYILDRGVYDAKTDSVFPNTPSKIFPMSENTPKNRLGLSKWLFNPKNPLTARVAVNRFWQHYFGTGLVKTSEDFGNQGEMPSHPELLDWLALHFINSDWDMKAIQKMIVLSSTYQQSSKASKQLQEIDPENRLLARGPSQRLTGEMLRDNALVASGLLTKQIGGKSVNPYQPEGLWRVNGAAYTEDKGVNLYRRSLYTIWKRSVPHPTLATFDAPARDVCTIRRQETNTPLQALLLLNDPIYTETARALGNEMLSYKKTTDGIAIAYKKLTGKTITNKELNLLADLQKTEYQKFKENPSKIKGWLQTGAFTIDKGADKALIAANAVVANTIMNSDATITKR